MISSNKRGNVSALGIVFCLLSPVAAHAWPSIGLDKLTDTKNLKSNLIDSTGIVTSSQVDTIVNAAEKYQAASRGFSAEQQYYLGRGVAALILRQYPLYTADPSLINYINLVGNALAIRSSKPELFGGYHFAVLDTKEVNALSAPGGFVFVSKGFLDLIPNEEALAAVLAHEIGHIVLGHGMNAISNARVTEATLLLGKEALNTFGSSEVSALTQNFGDSVNEIFDTLIKNGYSRTQEYEADAYAQDLLGKAGYMTEGLPMMLDELSKIKGQSAGGWMNTHPAPNERKAKLKKGSSKGASTSRAKRDARYLSSFTARTTG